MTCTYCGDPISNEDQVLGPDGPLYDMHPDCMKDEAARDAVFDDMLDNIE